MSDHAPQAPPGPVLSPRQLVMIDVLVAVGVAIAFAAVAVVDARRGSGEPVPVWVQCLVAAGTGLPVAVRRRWPLPVFVVVLVMSVLSMALDVVREPFLVAAYALYQVAVATARPRRLSAPVIGVASALALALLVFAGSSQGMPAGWGDGPGMALLGAAALGSAWTLGRTVRERRADAARHHARMAEHLAAEAVTEERLRIARELHDVVAHSLGVVAVKAAVANHVGQQRPEEAQHALRVIEKTSRDALAELRRMLGILRAGRERDEPVAGLGPAPRLAGLAELASRVESAGVRVELDLRGDGPVPPGVEVSTYRIVQEALTNVLTHAAPTWCRVAVRVAADGVEVDIIDDGHGAPTAWPPGPMTGHGLVGMRERVALYGGEFSAGPRAEGGFHVRARLPFEPEAQPGRAAELTP